MISFVDSDSKHPKLRWAIIKTDIEINIINKIIPSGGKVPSIAELARHYSVSNSTAIKALESLCNDGVLINKKGKGFYVVPFTASKLKEKHLELILNNLSLCFHHANLIKFDSSEIDEIINYLLSNLNKLTQTDD